jgi:pseudomonalisin/xanthomonalisin
LSESLEMKFLPAGTLRPLLIAAAAACVAGGAFAAPVTWTATRTQASDTRGLVAGAQVAADTKMHVAVSLKLRNEASLDSLVDDIMAGRSQQRLSSAQVLERYSPTVGQAEAVAAYLREAGFENVTIAGNRMLVSGDGTAATIHSAFDTTLRHFTVEGHDAFANESAARVPSQLAGIVNAVHGLDTINPVHLYSERATHQAVNPDSVVGHTPTDFATIYDADSLPTASDTTIAIMAAGNISQSLTDLKTYTNQVGFKYPTVKQVVVGTKGTETDADVEWDLDSQTSISTAGGEVAAMYFYIVNNVYSLGPFVEGFNQAVVDNKAQIVNASLGTCEIGEKNNGDESAIDTSFKLGIAQGQTFTISTGDSGAYQCSGNKVGESYPAVSPYASGIGGTTLSTTGTTQYLSESTWSDGGGGYSITEKEPKYQKKALGKMSGRAIPDISFSADPASGAIIVVNGGHQQWGGTSLSSPMFMGFWARIQTMHNNSLVSPNAAIYKWTQKSKNAKLYTHDVTTGSNGYAATPGWDLATGYGSLDMADFADFVGTHTGF